MATAHDDLLALLNETLFDMRKHFGMFGQIQVSIREVTPERLTVGIRTGKPLSGERLAENVRNAVLNRLQSLLPVQRFVAVYDNPTQKIVGEVHDLPYASELRKAGELESSEILIEENAGPAREKLRPRFREAWDRYVEEERR